MTTEIISPDLKTTLRRLRLSRILDTLPERLVLARQQKMPHQDWLLLILSDEGELSAEGCSEPATADFLRTGCGA
jgi:hypothetical protein